MFLANKNIYLENTSIYPQNTTIYPLNTSIYMKILGGGKQELKWTVWKMFPCCNNLHTNE